MAFDWNTPLLRRFFWPLGIALMAAWLFFTPRMGEHKMPRADGEPLEFTGPFFPAPGGATEADLKSPEPRVIVLDFWATWCGPCVASIPHMNELVEALRGEPVVFVSVTNESPRLVEDFLRKRPMKSLVAIDGKDALFRSFGIDSIPTIVILDPTRKVLKVTRPGALTAQGLREIVATAVPKSPAPAG